MIETDQQGRDQVRRKIEENRGKSRKIEENRGKAEIDWQMQAGGSN
jgi:hypothetical protein